MVTKAEFRKRNQAILRQHQLRHRYTDKAIAQRFGLSAARIRAIIKQHLKRTRK